ASVERDEAQEGADERGFPGPVGPEQPDRTWRHFHRQLLQGGDFAVGFGDIVQREQHPHPRERSLCQSQYLFAIRRGPADICGGPKKGPPDTSEKKRRASAERRLALQLPGRVWRPAQHCELSCWDNNEAYSYATASAMRSRTACSAGPMPARVAISSAS